MKLLFFLPKLEHSGAPKIMTWIANSMSNMGVEIAFISIYKSEPVNMLSDSVSYYSLDLEMSNNRFFRNTIQMSKVLYKYHAIRKAYQPDIVISFLDSFGYRLLLFSSIIPLPYKLVVSERVDPYSYPKKQALIRSFLISKADHIVFQTKGAQHYFNQKIYKKSSVIPNPVIAEKTNNLIVPSTQRRKEIVSVGRLVIKQKRQDILLKAFAIVHEQFPDYILKIYGEGPDRIEIQDMIVDLNLENSVILAGEVDNILDIINVAKVFVLTSDYEGIPNALIEAMSLGVPCVSTDCSPGGAALLIKNGINGFLVNKGDYRQISQRIIDVIESEELSDSFSEKSPLIIKDFSEHAIASQWLDMFTQLL